MQAIPPLHDPTLAKTSDEGVKLYNQASLLNMTSEQLIEAKKMGFKTPLSSGLRNAASAVYAYVAINDLTDLTVDEWVDGFCCDLNPEEEIFWWQRWTLSSVLASFTSLGQSLIHARARERMDVGVFDFEILHDDHVLRAYANINHDLRRKQSKFLFAAMNGVTVQDDLGTEEVKSVCLDALKQVVAATKEKEDKLASVNKFRMGKFSKACSACERIPDGVKFCARCMKTSYCSRECQQEQWPQHQFECHDEEVEDDDQASTSQDTVDLN